jgi:hypothetical protein
MCFVIIWYVICLTNEKRCCRSFVCLLINVAGAARSVRPNCGVPSHLTTVQELYDHQYTRRHGDCSSFNEVIMDLEAPPSCKTRP